MFAMLKGYVCHTKMIWMFPKLVGHACNMTHYEIKHKLK